MPPKKAAAAKKKAPAKEAAPVAAPAPAQASTFNDEDDALYQEPTKRIVRPKNALALSEPELMEEFTRVITATDPNVPANITKYSYKERMFKQEPPAAGDHLAIHFSMDGYMLHKESDEAKQQETILQEKREADEAKRKALQESGDAEDDGNGDTVDSGKNQFNYSDRAAQTFNNPMRSRGVATEPPPVLPFSATVTQWQIYDSFIESHMNAMREAEIQKAGQSKKDKTDESKAEAKPAQSTDGDMVHSAQMALSLKIMERMVNQNAEDEIYQDFKYWEDASDQFREGEGSLLPLWKFSTDRTKRKQVTAMGWNPQFQDLFAVGYGSYDFMRQGTGMICCFSLKNTSNPEYTFTTESGVMCLDFHPQHHALLAVGCYDGTVMVFDVRNKVNRPIYASNIKTGKHTDPVWQVSWQEEDLAKELNFFSISSDGRVANWTMSKNELKMETIMQLKLINNLKEEPEEAHLSGLAGGCCFDFNKFSEHLFVVGTEEGKIHKCSKAYSGQYLETYEGHHMAVYAVKWNAWHPDVFVSCSADWTVKIWNHQCKYPIMSFDLGNAVGDVMFAPYSSTVFSAVTSDGKVHVFDLNENKHEPLCEQKVVKPASLTHVTFNRQDPMILVGDNRGAVNSLKLSPNLRKITADPEAEVPSGVPIKELEKEKLDKLLAAADNKPEGA